MPESVKQGRTPDDDLGLHRRSSAPSLSNPKDILPALTSQGAESLCRFTADGEETITTWGPFRTPNPADHALVRGSSVVL
jgi:hypothetical protein